MLVQGHADPLQHRRQPRERPPARAALDLGLRRLHRVAAEGRAPLFRGCDGVDAVGGDDQRDAGIALSPR